MKFRKFIAFIIVLGLMNLNSIFIQAQDNMADVTITTDIPNTQTTQEINGTVYIQYNDVKMYNDMVKFSYHICDKDNNILVFENERIPFNITDGKAQINLSIKLNEMEAVANKKNLIIRFDLVDEQNIYWYNDNPNINIQTVEIIYENTFLGRVKEVYGNVFSRQIVQLLVSVSFIIVMIYLYRRIKKEQLV